MAARPRREKVLAKGLKNRYARSICFEKLSSLFSGDIPYTPITGAGSTKRKFARLIADECPEEVPDLGEDPDTKKIAAQLRLAEEWDPVAFAAIEEDDEWDEKLETAEVPTTSKMQN